ncbi:MAG: GNAT family N-acetyltransferase [Anaerolineae bacterium]
MNTIDIYDADAQDIPELQALVQAVFATRHDADHITRLMHTLYSEQSFQQVLTSTNRHLIVAIVDEALVGYCQYGVPIMDDCDCEDLREIQALFVHPNAEHDAVASALIYDVEETINAQAGVQRMSVFVDEGAQTIVRFYASLGFYHDQVEDRDGAWYMEKDL